MITPNTKVTALDVLKECGVKTPADKFGKVRVRIGGIAGINRPDYLITIQPETTSLEVIVGSEIYDLELSKGNDESNKDVFEVTADAKGALEVRGAEATKKANKNTQVKELARKIIAHEDSNEEYEPTKAEEKLLNNALDRVDAIRDAQKNPVVRDKDRPVKKVKSS